MKIAVIISDATHLVNAGTDVVRTYRTFDLPNDIAEYIEAASGIAYATVSFAIPDERENSR